MDPPRKRRYRIARKIIFASAVFVVLFEISARAILHFTPLGSFFDSRMIIESLPDQPNFVFDPVSGYKLPPRPLRMAVFERDGGAVSIGTVRGNNLGYPDSHDFGAKPATQNQRRLAVFGDSMSAGLFLEKNWPERVEENLSREGRAIELMNFSIDGGGFMNWWSIINRLLKQEAYTIDGCIFAICFDDLYRGFFSRHDYLSDGVHHNRFGRGRSQRVADLPSSLRQAEQSFLALLESVWVEVQSSAMKEDGVLEALTASEAACGVLDPLDL